MLVDKNDEDEEEVGGHPQDPDTGQEDGAHCVLLENKYNGWQEMYCNEL